MQARIELGEVQILPTRLGMTTMILGQLTVMWNFKSIRTIILGDGLVLAVRKLDAMVATRFWYVVRLLASLKQGAKYPYP